MNGGDNRRLVERFWAAMGENDWRAVAGLFTDGFVLEWPQSGELIRGRDGFVAVNEQYPAAGRWRFAVHRIVADDDGAASDVSVTDGAIDARVQTFFEIRDGRIARIVEFWPEPFEPAAWRAPLVERADGVADRA